MLRLWRDIRFISQASDFLLTKEGDVKARRVTFDTARSTSSCYADRVSTRSILLAAALRRWLAFIHPTTPVVGY